MATAMIGLSKPFGCTDTRKSLAAQCALACDIKLGHYPLAPPVVRAFRPSLNGARDDTPSRLPALEARLAFVTKRGDPFLGVSALQTPDVGLSIETMGDLGLRTLVGVDNAFGFAQSQRRHLKYL